MIIKNGNVFQEDGSYKVTDLIYRKWQDQQLPKTK